MCGLRVVVRELLGSIRDSVVRRHCHRRSETEKLASIHYVTANRGDVFES